MGKDIALEELLSEIERLHRGGGKGQSVADIVKATGKTESKVRKLLRAGKESGEIVSDYEFRPSIADRMQQVPVYRRAEGKVKKK